MNKRTLRMLKVGAYILLPITLFILPVGFFDQGKSICLSQVIAGQQCPGCGITRGIMHLIHFDFQGAYDLNKLSFVVLPVLVFIWGKDLLKDLRFIRKEGQLSKAVQGELK